MDKYVGFISQIPEETMQKVETHFCNEIALFKPDTFIAGKLMCSEDFLITIPSEAPPDTHVNGKLQSFNSGKIVAFNPGDTVLSTGEGTKKRYLSLLIKPELINRTAEEMGHSGAIRFLKLQNPHSRKLMQVINDFDREIVRPDSFPVMLDCLGIQIATLLLREFKTNLKKYPINSPDMDSYIDSSIEYIHTFYSANITIKDICNEINVSPFHFIRTFKEKTGLSPHQYLLKVRIVKAEEILRSRWYSIAEVATLCGFVSLSHFSNTFKEMTGHTPSEYKKTYINF